MGIHRKRNEWERLTALGAKSLGLPKSLPEARKAKASHYYTDIPCKYGHLVVRRTEISGCPRCNQLKSRALPMDSRPPHMVKVFHQHMNLNNRKLGFRGVEGCEIEE